MADSETMRTTEGTTWPIVLLVEVVGEGARAWTRALEEANIIVLAEASILRGAFVVASERPHVVIVSSALPTERTQVVRDAARDVGAEWLSLATSLPPAELRVRVERALAEVMPKRQSMRPPRRTHT